MVRVGIKIVLNRKGLDNLTNVLILRGLTGEARYCSDERQRGAVGQKREGTGAI